MTDCQNPDRIRSLKMSDARRVYLGSVINNNSDQDPEILKVLRIRTNAIYYYQDDCGSISYLNPLIRSRYCGHMKRNKLGLPSPVCHICDIAFVWLYVISQPAFPSYRPFASVFFRRRLRKETSWKMLFMGNIRLWDVVWDHNGWGKNNRKWRLRKVCRWLADMGMSAYPFVWLYYVYGTIWYKLKICECDFWYSVFGSRWLVGRVEVIISSFVHFW